MKAALASRNADACPGTARLGTQLVAFFIASFVIAWAAWIPLMKWRALPSQLAFIGLFAPALAGLFSASVFGGAGAVRRMLGRLRIVAFPLRWALFAAFVMPAMYFAALVMVRAFGVVEGLPLVPGTSAWFILAAFLWLLFVNSGEELGWRGYALPRLLEQSPRPILVSLGLGVIWGIWHLPLYLLPGQSAFPFPLFLIFTTLQSVVYTMVFTRTRGSLLPALLLHAGTDIAPRVFLLSRVPASFWMLVDVMLGMLVIGLAAGFRRHSHSGASLGESL